MLDPSNKYQVALEKATKDPKKSLESKCPLEVLLAQKSLGLPVVENALHRAYEIYSRKKNSKIVMESLLFCMEPVETLTDRITKHMNTAPAVTEYYAMYFFDASVFVDLFDRLDYIEHLAESDEPYDIKDKITKQLAMTEGFSYVLSYFKGSSIDYTATEYIRKLLAIANKFVAQSQNKGILSTEADKLYKWMQLGSKLSLTLKTLSEESGEDALQDIRIALEYDKTPDSIDVLPPEDVLRG